MAVATRLGRVWAPAAMASASEKEADDDSIDLGTSVVPQAAQRTERPAAVTALAMMNLIVAAIEFAVAYFSQKGMFIPFGDQAVPTPAAAGFLFLSALARFTISVWLFSMDRRGWLGQLAFAGLGIFVSLPSIIASILILIYLLRPGVRAAFQVEIAGITKPEDRAQIDEDTPSPKLVTLAVAIQLMRALVSLIPVLRALAA
jgi:hypothetical protein